MKELEQRIEREFFQLLKNSYPIIIYGFGDIGQALYQKLKVSHNILGIVDKEKFGKEIDSLLIVSPDKFQYKISQVTSDIFIVVNTILNYQQSKKVKKKIISLNINYIVIQLRDYIKHLDTDIDSLLQLANKNGYLCKCGWLSSIKESIPIAHNGSPLPWVTYPYIDFIKGRLNKTMRVFEFGCGNSTLWYGKKVLSVVALEHDVHWFNKIKSISPKNVKLNHVDLTDGSKYSQFLSTLECKFDLIIIDGRDRVNCIKNSLDSLSDKGVIILDDSERDSYKEGKLFLYSKGFKELDFWGIAPGITFNKCTSVFFKLNNCLNI